MSKVTARQKVAALKACMMAENMLAHCGLTDSDDLQNDIIDEEFAGDEDWFCVWEKKLAVDVDAEAFKHFWANE